GSGFSRELPGRHRRGRETLAASAAPTGLQLLLHWTWAWTLTLTLTLTLGPLRSGGGGGSDPQGAAHGGAAFSAGAGCPLGKSRRLREPGATHRARRRGVLSLRQVSLHRQRKVARVVTARKLLVLIDCFRSRGK